MFCRAPGVAPPSKALEDAEANARSAERAADEMMLERDDREEQVADMARQAGCELEFSNLHDHRECVAERFAVLEARLLSTAKEIRDERARWEGQEISDGSFAAQLGRIASKCEDDFHG